MRATAYRLADLTHNAAHVIHCRTAERTRNLVSGDAFRRVYINPVSEDWHCPGSSKRTITSSFAQMSDNSNSPQIQLFNELNLGFKERSVDLLGKPLHKDFRRCTYPRSLNQPDQNKDEWLKHFGGIIAVITSFEVGQPLPFK